ncbi:mitochondrial 54S ribosomal protein YmL41 [Parahypoxylon ruwenzoriense]
MVVSPFRIGTKRVFLPHHMITFLRPRGNQPPHFAIFKVPLKFNKLDLRDYLLHAYNVPVTGVRSQLRQQRPRRSKVHGRIYRPPPVKTMTVELTKAFVWPERPADVSAWNTPQLVKQHKSRTNNEKWHRKLQKKGTIPLRDEMGASFERKSLRKEAKRLLAEGGWKNDRVSDVRFTEGKAKNSE